MMNTPCNKCERKTCPGPYGCAKYSMWFRGVWHNIHQQYLKARDEYIRQALKEKGEEAKRVIRWVKS